MRVIEYGELERVGGSGSLRVNVRLVCATNADLPAMVNEEPLFALTCSTDWLLMFVQLPLRERSDIMLMAEHFAPSRCVGKSNCLCSGSLERARNIAELS